MKFIKCLLALSMGLGFNLSLLAAGEFSLVNKSPTTKLTALIVNGSDSKRIDVGRVFVIASGEKSEAQEVKKILDLDLSQPTTVIIQDQSGSQLFHAKFDKGQPIYLVYSDKMDKDGNRVPSVVRSDSGKALRSGLIIDESD